MSTRVRWAGLALAVALSASQEAGAGDLWSDDVRTLLRTDTISVEALVGYVTGSSKEYVYDPSSGRKLSHLNWDIGNSMAAGGRLAVRPLDWLTVRARGWTVVAGDSKMHDFDWLYGYVGFQSYSHVSVHPDTVTPKIWQGDVSAAVNVYEDAGIGLSIVGGYRHYEAKFDARGGSFIYSTRGFRDFAGTFPAGQSGILYRQSWDAPYLGFSVAYTDGAWTGSIEMIGSTFAQGDAEDQHLLRTLNIKSKLGYSNFLGINTALEYRLTDHLSAVGRFEYQNFYEARGRAVYTDYGTRQIFTNPKPGSGAEAETLLLSVGLKARM